MRPVHPPGPRGSWFGLSLLRDMQRDFFGFWRGLHRDYGDAVYMRFAHLDYYAFMHPEQIREVLVDKSRSFIRHQRQVQVLAQVHGQSVLTTEGDVWQRQRRTVLPAFSPKRFGEYARQMTDAISEMLAALPADGYTAIDFEHAMNLLSTDVILRTMFGEKLPQDTAAIEQAVRSLGEIGYEEMFVPASLPDWLPGGRRAEKRSALQLLDQLIWSHIHSRRASGERRPDLLGMLLSGVDGEGDGRALSEKEVRDQMMTMFLAGHETTASALAWAGWLLAAHPDVASAARAEVDRVLAGRIPSAGDVHQLPYLTTVIKETLRMYSPAAGVFLRCAVEDVQVGGWMVPKGSLVSILSVVPHADERWFPNPDSFDPSRFEEAAARDIPRGAYFPFGAGPRVCIGNSFAMMEMTLILAMLLQRFELRPAPGQGQPGLKMRVTLRPEGGVQLTLQAHAAAGCAASSVSSEAGATRACPYHD